MSLFSSAGGRIFILATHRVALSGATLKWQHAFGLTVAQIQETMPAIEGDRFMLRKWMSLRGAVFIAAVAAAAMWLYARQAGLLNSARTGSLRANAEAVTVPDTQMYVKGHLEVSSPAITSAPRDTLRARRTLGDSNTFARITAIHALGRRLVVADSKTSPHLFLFDLETGDLIATGGRQGQGPGEIIHPAAISTDARDDAKFWVYDFSLRRFVQFNADDLGRGGAVRPVSLPVGGSLLQPVLRADDIASNGLFHEYSLAFFTLDGRPIGRADLRPPFAPPEVSDQMGRRLLNVSYMAYSPETHNRLAMAYAFSGELDILNLETGLHTKVKGPQQTRASYSYTKDRNAFIWNNDNQHAYWGAAGTEDFLVGLFSGARDDMPPVQANRLHFFDWSGRFLGEIGVDRPLTTIAVDPRRNVLYGAIEDPWPMVVEYSLSSILPSLLGTGR